MSLSNVTYRVRRPDGRFEIRTPVYVMIEAPDRDAIKRVEVYTIAQSGRFCGMETFRGYLNESSTPERINLLRMWSEAPRALLTPGDLSEVIGDKCQIRSYEDAVQIGIKIHNQPQAREYFQRYADRVVSDGPTAALGWMYAVACNLVGCYDLCVELRNALHRIDMARLGR